MYSPAFLPKASATATSTSGPSSPITPAFSSPSSCLKNASSVSPHWLRHAHASHAMDRGAKIHLVRETLGHASVATTARYLHTRPDESSALFLGS